MSSPNELNHRLDTAAAHASANVPVVTAEDTADAALRGLLGKRFDSASVLAVCRDGALIGLLTVERLLAASPQERIGDVIGRVAVREVVTGVFLGAALACLAFPVILLVWGDPRVAWAVAVALLAASSIATAVAMALPWLFHRLGRDPAFGSGPLATVVQDLLSVLIYFVIATAIV